MSQCSTNSFWNGTARNPLTGCTSPTIFKLMPGFHTQQWSSSHFSVVFIMHYFRNWVVFIRAKFDGSFVVGDITFHSVFWTRNAQCIEQHARQMSLTLHTIFTVNGGDSVPKRCASATLDEAITVAYISLSGVTRLLLKIRAKYLIWCNLLTSTSPQTFTIWSDLSNYLENENNSETHLLV